MRLPKPTPSKDGKPRATVRVAFRVSSEDIRDAWILDRCHHQSDEAEDIPIPSTRSEAFKVLTSVLHSRGSDLTQPILDAYDYAGGSEDLDRIRDRIESAIAKLFPDFG